MSQGRFKHYDPTRLMIRGEHVPVKSAPLCRSAPTRCLIAGGVARDRIIASHLIDDGLERLCQRRKLGSPAHRLRDAGVRTSMICDPALPGDTYSGRCAPGRPIVFGFAVFSVILFAATGPLFGFSDGWQLAV
jgi:Low affinity iron permease